MSRWMMHFLGSVHVMGQFGGIENLFIHYPHLQLPLTHVAHFETVWIIMSHIPLTKPKQASRRALEMLCQASTVKRKFCNPLPSPLLLILWDICTCAAPLLAKNSAPSAAELQKREQILLGALSFLPEDGTKEVKEAYYKDLPM
jgi:hypothetical protein